MAKLAASSICERLLPWFKQHGRKHLPWQQQRNAYTVWLSEIMLQQTQVATVIPYFERFLQQFPTIDDLAQASLDEVLHLWTGLGYYARARRLHQTAQLIMSNYSGQFPKTVEALQALPGIGRSTAGAIVAAAFELRATILDGNVKRVLTRVHAIAGWPGNTQVNKQLWDLAEHYTPKRQVRAYTQAIMDLGATVCKIKQPDCRQCPLQNCCLAYRHAKVDKYPEARPRRALPVRKRCFLILLDHKRQVLLEKRPEKGIWGGLWCLPDCDLNQDVASFCADEYHLDLQTQKAQPAFRHTFTHFHLDIHPVTCRVKSSSKKRFDQQQRLWYNPKHPPALGLATPIRRLLQNLLEPAS